MFFFVPCTTGIPPWNIFIYRHFYTKWNFHCWVGLKNHPGAFEARFQPAMLISDDLYFNHGIHPPLAKQNQDISRHKNGWNLSIGNFAPLSKVQQIPTLDIDTSPSASNDKCGRLLRAQPLEGLLLLQPPCLPCLLSAKKLTRCHQFMVYFTKLCSNHIHPYPVILYVLSFTNDSWSNHIIAAQHLTLLTTCIKDVARSRWLQTFFHMNGI